VREACATSRRSNRSCLVSSGKSRSASACSAVMLSSTSPWAVSLLLRSAGTDSLPSMVLIVSSQTVAAETCTPCAEMIACRACGPRRGLSSSSHSRAWLSRSSIAAGPAGFAGFAWLAVLRVVEHLLDVRIDVERLIVGIRHPSTLSPYPRSAAAISSRSSTSAASRSRASGASGARTGACTAPAPSTSTRSASAGARICALNAPGASASPSSMASRSRAVRPMNPPSPAPLRQRMYTARRCPVPGPGTTDLRSG
jgi:hypothetical protein